METCKELSNSVMGLRKKGVKDIIIDPGFGFAKDLEQNYELFENLDFLKSLECPILVGVSRKSMIYKLLGVRSEEHTSELQSRPHLVCRLLLEKKKRNRRRVLLCTT